MYRIDYTDEYNALEKLYVFLKIPFLNNPECSVWKKQGAPTIYTGIASNFQNKLDFLNELEDMNFTAVTCVASTDKMDERRVTLTFMPEISLMVLSFPQSNGNLNHREQMIFEYLEMEI